MEEKWMDGREVQVQKGSAKEKCETEVRNRSAKDKCETEVDGQKGSR